VREGRALGSFPVQGSERVERESLDQLGEGIPSRAHARSHV
jgi:hypothetical protein